MTSQKFSQKRKFDFFYNNGFTLIELTVSIFMLVTLASIITANYSQGDKSRRVALASDGVINAARLAQNYALSGRQIDQTPCPNKSAVSYRINFDHSSEYVIYAEDNCSNPLFEIQKFSLPQGTKMDVSEMKIDGQPVSTLYIKFTLPFAQISASGDSGAFESFTIANIGVEHIDETRSKTIIVDGVSGRIGE